MDANTVQQFKKVVEDIVDARIENKGITKYVSAIVSAVNSDGTVNVYLPPDNKNMVSHLLNKTGERLSVGDSVELCTKNGKANNSWVAVRHGADSIGLASYPVGSIYMSVNSTSPASLFGGTWERYANGRTLVGLDTSQTEFNSIGKTGGSKELQTHYHDGIFWGSQAGAAPYTTTYLSGDREVLDIPVSWARANYSSTRHMVTGTSGSGNGGNLQPYIVVYIWRRTA